jgi:hypothetical protein
MGRALSSEPLVTCSYDAACPPPMHPMQGCFLDEGFILKPCNRHLQISFRILVTPLQSGVCLLAQESFLDEGFILDKRIGVGQPKRIENANILVANTAMDTDKIKIYGARVRVDSMQKVQVAIFCFVWQLRIPLKNACQLDCSC